MKIVIDIPNSLYANLGKIRRNSIACDRILDCVRNGKKVNGKKVSFYFKDIPPVDHRDGYMHLEDILKHDDECCIRFKGGKE